MIKDTNILIDNGVDLKKSLELFGDMAMYDDSLGDFLAEVENKLFKIAHFKDVGDMINYAILVHSLKSDARYFGFTKLADLSYEHEIQSKEKNLFFVKNNYDTLKEEADKIIILVKEYLSSSAKPPTTGTLEADAPVSTPCVEEEIEELVVMDSSKNTILVADDSNIITNFVKKIFENEYNVLVASNGLEAITFIKQNSSYNIKALLLDLNMPGVDGFKVLEFMQQNNLFNDIPVTIITGNDSVDVNLSAFEYPIIDILNKPFSEIAARNILYRTIQSKVC